MTLPGATVVRERQASDPISEAQGELERAQRARQEAREAVLELVRQRRGNGGRSVIDEVAVKTGLDSSFVQQEVWALLAAGDLKTDDDGNILGA